VFQHRPELLQTFADARGAVQAAGDAMAWEPPPWEEIMAPDQLALLDEQERAFKTAEDRLAVVVQHIEELASQAPSAEEASR
jgi:hypothetical protein